MFSVLHTFRVAADGFGLALPQSAWCPQGGHPGSAPETVVRTVR